MKRRRNEDKDKIIYTKHETFYRPLRCTMYEAEIIRGWEVLLFPIVYNLLGGRPNFM
jgi:hypothetical protein